jgi:hypothetical protein
VEPLQTIVNASVVGAVGLILAWMVHGTRSEIGQLRAEVRADISNLRTEVRTDISELRREFGELRSDLTQVALAVGARPRAGQGS